MKHLSILLLALGLTNVRADVIVYKLSGTFHIVGGNLDARAAETGFAVFNPDTSEFQMLYANSKGGKTYGTQSLSVTVAPIYGALGRIGTSISSQTATGIVTLYGYNASLTISESRSVSVPKAMSCRIVETEFGSQSDATTRDSTLHLSFDSKDTLTANASALTVSAEIAQLVALYQSKGYIQD